MVEGIARNLAPVDHDVVAACGLGRNVERAQHFSHHFNIAVEGERNILALCDIREHDVVHVGIHTASATFSSISLDIVLSAIFDVHLVFDELVASEYHAWLHLPHKEAVVGGIDISGYELLHGEVET